MAQRLNLSNGWLADPANWVGQYLTLDASGAVSNSVLTGLVRPELALKRESDRVALRLRAHVLGQEIPPSVHREVVREPVSWREHWKLTHRWWTTGLDGIPLARWVKAHPRLARALVRNPAGRWALRRPVVLWLNRRHPVRWRCRTVEVAIDRRVLYPHARLTEPVPEALGRPVVVYGAPESSWPWGRPYDPPGSKDS